MRTKHVVIAMSIVVAVLLPVAVLGAPGDLGVEEAGLDSPVARPRQINQAPDGTLLVSIDRSAEIRKVSPQSGAYTAYTHDSALVSPVDARSDVEGNIWYADWTLKTLGRISGNSLTTWVLPNAGAPWGVALDASSRIWVADLAAPYLFRVDPATNRVCRYTLPDGGISEHVVYGGGKLWLGDNSSGRILRVTPLTTLDRIQLESWPVPPVGDRIAYPIGLAVDAGGNLWWADNKLGFLARLEPGTNLMTSFTPPAGTAPVMLSFAGDGIWYTEDAGETVGFLDPVTATGQATVLTPASPRTITPSCQTVTPGQFSATTANGVLNWSANNWPTLATGNGWTVYQMPLAPQRSDPYGIVAASGYVWAADRDRAVLARFPYTAPATRTPTATPTGSTSTPTASPTATETATPTATATASLTPTVTATATPTATQTPTPTATPTMTATASAQPFTKAPTATPTMPATHIFLPPIVK